MQTQVLTDEVYHYSFGGQVSTAKLTEFLSGQHRTRVLSYILVPVVLLLRMLIVSFCLLAGLLLTSRKPAFSQLFRIVLIAEAAPVAGVLIKLLILSFFVHIDTISQFEALAPFSVYSFLNAAAVPRWLVCPLQSLDIFQAAYILLLAGGLRHYLKFSFRNALRWVLCTYGLGLLCLMIGLAFLVISFNP